jgi:cytokinin dehydrogenase
VWLPDRNVDAYIAEVLPTLGPDDLGPTGLMFLFPHRRSRFRRPFFRLPTDERVWLFDILTSNAVVGPDAAYERRMLDRNRSLYERARDLGGTRYPIGSIEFARHDWIRQYGLSYLPFKLLQHRYDPDGILTPGVRI